MLAYLLRRGLVAVLLVLALASGVFLLVRAMPGDAASLFLDPELSATDAARVRDRLGLDRPLLEQYLTWLGGVLHGDLGLSLRQQRPVADIIAEAIGPTLLLTVTAFTVEIGVGILLGVTMARWRGRRRERVLHLASLALYSMPSFWLGLMAILVFSRELGWLPGGGLSAPDAAFLPPVRRWLDLVSHLALPVLVLGLGNVAVTARFVRAGLAEVLAQDWILAARARGLSEREILWRHALRAALLPLVTLAGLSLPYLLGGAVVVEEVFAWPGMGRVTVEALQARDVPVLMATTLLAAILVVAGNLLADLLYHWADPRVRPVAGGGGRP